MEIRDATSDDSAVIARIYNQGIEDRAATLETAIRTAEERRGWLLNRSTRHPVLVAVERDEDSDDDSNIVGWASLNPFNPRPAYDHVADVSVYVARERHGSGMGTALLRALEARARRLGYHKVVLAAFPWNTAGARLYQRQGFRTVGVYHEQGLLDGAWVDVVVMEKILPDD